MSITVLFVDDEPDLEALVQQKFRRQIRDGAVKVMFAHDGLEALATIEQNPAIDMVVSDITMPRMDGVSSLSITWYSRVKPRPLITSLCFTGVQIFERTYFS